jgi:hypothetical protein
MAVLPAYEAWEAAEDITAIEKLANTAGLFAADVAVRDTARGWLSAIKQRLARQDLPTSLLRGSQASATEELLHPAAPAADQADGIELLRPQSGR